MSAEEAYAAKVLTYSPRTYFKKNEASGTTMADYGSVGAAGAYGAADIAGQSTGPSGSDLAPLFVPADDDYADAYTVGMATGFDPDDTSISFWFRNDADVTATNGQNGFQIKADASNLIRFYVVANDTYRFQWRTGGSNSLILVTASTNGLDDNDWHHCLMVFDVTGNTFTVFIDGSSVGTGTCVTWGGTGLSSTECVIGAIDTTPAGTTWNGSIKEWAHIPSILDGTDAAALATYGA